MNFRSISCGKPFTSRSVTVLPSSVAVNRRFSASTYPFLVMVERIVAYVLGRPMPSFSSVLTSDASLYRGGGWVKCWLAIRPSLSSVCPSASGGRIDVLLLAGRPDPAVAVELLDLPRALNTPWSARISTVVVATRAGVIWLATNRL